MFEATIKMTATLQEGKQGKQVLKVFAKQEEDDVFDFLLSNTYYEDIYRLLQAGDTLTVTFYTAKDEKSIVAAFRDDKQWGYAFEVDGQEPTPDLYPLIENIYQPALLLLQPGDTLTATYHIQRL